MLLKSVRVSARKQAPDNTYAAVEHQRPRAVGANPARRPVDSDSFAQFLKAGQLPQNTATEHAIRQRAMHDAAVVATESALDILDLGNAVLDCAHQVQFRVSPIIRAR